MKYDEYGTARTSNNKYSTSALQRPVGRLVGINFSKSTETRRTISERNGKKSEKHGEKT